jgi:hypothetical protein
MDGQLLIVGTLVAAAGAYLTRRAWRTWGGRKSGCGGACGCAGSAERSHGDEPDPFIPREQLTLRRRDKDPS